ncbi:MAG: rhomboid family intramembrane serine protease [Bacteroidales bacterium]|nr:rhomboid family intramembrane serine protease [Bacteroidales bacterium]
MTNYNYGQNQNPLDEIKRFFRQGSALSILILVNVAIWVFVQALKVILFFYNSPGSDAVHTLFLHSLAIPASIPGLAMKPWTILTYMFLHFDIWHILFNMLWLYWFGRIFLEFLPSKQLVSIYFLGGISGGLFYVLAFNFFPVFSSLLPISFALGASASVMAIVTSISVYVPNYTIQLLLIGRLKIIYLAVILFVFDFFMIPSGNAGGHIAHIGGALFGAIYMLLYRYSKNKVQYGNSPDLIRNFINLFKNKAKTGHSPGVNYGRPVSDEDYNLKKKETQKKVDEILEKISKGGYDCLSKEEKEFLFKTSNKR